MLESTCRTIRVDDSPVYTLAVDLLIVPKRYVSKYTAASRGFNSLRQHGFLVNLELLNSRIPPKAR